MHLIKTLSVFSIILSAIIGGCGTGTSQPGNDNNQATGGGGGVADRNGDEYVVDRQEDALSSVPNFSHNPVCSGGKLRCFSHVRVENGKIKSMATTPSGLKPADLVSAYKLDTSVDPSATVAIVGAYHYANAASDLATYRSQFGLPACTTTSGCLKVVNQNGSTSSHPVAPPSGDDWTLELALDLQMVSAGCPKCKIVLVEADDDSGDGLFVANTTAATLSGVKVISNSWGTPEQAGDPVTKYESYFSHANVGTFAASGDDGYDDGGQGPDYPGTSAHVTAVGGTTLTKSTSTSRGWVEGAWGTNSGNGAGGSACSLSIPKPSWQGTTKCSYKATADVSAVGNPNTGVAVYNSANGGWVVIGGTSASSPFVAAVYALTGHGGSESPSFAYKNAGDYFDITTGSNGTCGNILCNAGAGWDGPTGMGSPNGAALKGGTTCTPNCSGKVCGDNGCGGSCGTCATGTSCNSSGQCVSTCTPNCSNKSCGSDGCGGSCGACSGGATCNSSGACVGGGSCSHAICSTGAKLTSGCDTCVTSICKSDSYCCSTSWDSICVGEVSSICNQSCGSSGCAHSKCSTGAKLKSGCDACVTKICGQDSYCCSTSWDSVCVGEVASICGQSC